MEQQQSSNHSLRVERVAWEGNLAAESRMLDRGAGSIPMQMDMDCGVVSGERCCRWSLDAAPCLTCLHSVEGVGCLSALTLSTWPYGYCSAPPRALPRTEHDVDETPTESPPGKRRGCEPNSMLLEFALARFISREPHVFLVHQFARHAGHRKPQTSSCSDIIPKTIPLPIAAYPRALESQRDWRLLVSSPR